MTSSLPWIGLALVALALLAMDLRGAQRTRDPTLGPALARSAAWFALAALFGAQVTRVFGATQGLAFYTAYVVEQALSLDNLFVMMLVFARYQVPRAAQRRVLTWGIAGVVVLRGAMILSGAALIEQLHVLTYVLGGFLLVASIKLARELSPEPTASPAAPPGSARVHALVSRVMPLSPDFAGDRFTVVRAGVRHATPLLLALLAIELADAVFALDSIPAVFGITTDRFIVFSSNLFAVLGLRSLFFALSGLLDKLRFLKHGLVGVLGVVGTKMVVAAWWPAPAWLSLALVAIILGGAIVASLRSPASIPNPDRISSC
ncbi:MAG: TerC/Alx family metal homeostasis membrane protein [Kofleriaceae bacterium]